MSAPPRVVLFDLDGTITDPSRDFVVSLRHALGVVGVPVPGDAALVDHLGPPLHDTLRSFGLDDAQIPVATAAYRATYDAQESSGTTVHAGIPALLADVRAAGCRLGVATSKPRLIADKVLVQLGLRDAFDAVAGASLDERDAAKDRVIALALSQHGDPHPGEVIMVGDRRFDVEGARRHGIDTIAVQWGFAQPGELAAAGARAVVADVDALRAELWAATAVGSAPA